MPVSPAVDAPDPSGNATATFPVEAEGSSGPALAPSGGFSLLRGG